MPETNKTAAHDSTVKVYPGLCNGDGFPVMILINHKKKKKEKEGKRKRKEREKN